MVYILAVFMCGVTVVYCKDEFIMCQVVVCLVVEEVFF